MKRFLLSSILIVALFAASVSAAVAAPTGGTIGINVMLNQPATNAVLADLGTHGQVRDVLAEINALTMQISADQLETIRALPYVAAANPDAVRKAIPVAAGAVADFSGGMSTWDLDVVNVTDFNATTRTVAQDGSGVYVAVLDTGLLSTWRSYFPAERIATQYAAAFGGGGGEQGTVSTQPNKWQSDTDSHGTHVTSTILGYALNGAPVNGVAPKATVIPVKVLNQNGSGWSSVIARGIVYVANLKAGKLKNAPVVINMSLGGSMLDAVEKAALDYAISKGVIVVASAGNEGTAGMGYPGAYAPVISVAATGWTGQWTASGWWRTLDVPETDYKANTYIADFSSRQLSGQDLDVAAPGAWIVGPYQVNQGQLSYYYLSGTSMSSPHVAGIVALMAQKKPSLTQTTVESLLERAALPLDAGCRTVVDPDAGPVDVCWDSDATGAGLITADAALRLVK